MLTLSVMLIAMLFWARHEWRMVKAQEAELAKCRRDMDKLADFLKDVDRCEVCHEATPWLVPVELYDSIEWTCAPCSAVIAARAAA